MSQATTINSFSKLLKEDKKVRETYRSDLAAEFKDEYHRYRLKNCPKGKRVNASDIDKIANTAAKNFLNDLINK